MVRVIQNTEGQVGIWNPVSPHCRTSDPAAGVVGPWHNGDEVTSGAGRESTMQSAEAAPLSWGWGTRAISKPVPSMTRVHAGLNV
jgi:hypothetical protein